MFIESIDVDEGFLAGLRIEFSRGLNVLIGARGTGKTSVIELIRYAFGAGAFTERAEIRSRQHATSILGSGKVTVTYWDDFGRHQISRTGTEPISRAANVDDADLVVIAQSEIEAVGASSTGRRQLIDGFRRQGARSADGFVAHGARLRSVSAELALLRRDLDELELNIASLEHVSDDLRAAEVDQTQILIAARATESQTSTLAALQESLAEVGRRDEILRATEQFLEDFSLQLEYALEAAPTLPRPDQPEALDPIAELRSDLESLVRAVRGVVVQSQQVVARAATLAAANAEMRASVDSEMRAVRQGLETFQAGLGAITRRVQQLRELEGQRLALFQRSDDYRSRVEKARMERREAYRRLDDSRRQRFESRRRVAEALNNELGPLIQVVVSFGEDRTGLVNELVAALRGTGIHYNQLAPRIASTMSPLEFVEAVEQSNIGEISRATDLSLDRSRSIVASFGRNALPEIVSCDIEDGVKFSLLDGALYKDSNEVSIGQRCTIVLPIILSHSDATVIVDQPEDHLDNAFITESLVETLRRRKPNQQRILVSHNANIPVLGEADVVVAMASDGSHAVVSHSGPLDDPATVDAITTIMEGGVEAFERRARFYRRHARRE